MSGKTTEIRIGEAIYPFRMTMGAMVRFSRMTGRDVSEMKPNSISDLSALLYACVASACAADGVDFPYNYDQFCDLVDADRMSEMAASVQTSEGEGDGGKKS